MDADFSGKKKSDAKLTEAIVRQVRIRRSEGESTSSLAREFGVQVGSMSEAIRGRTWKWVQ